MRLDGRRGYRGRSRSRWLPSYTTQTRYTKHVLMIDVGRPAQALSDGFIRHQLLKSRPTSPGCSSLAQNQHRMKSVFSLSRVLLQGAAGGFLCFCSLAVLDCHLRRVRHLEIRMGGYYRRCVHLHFRSFSSWEPRAEWLKLDWGAG